MLFTSQWCVFPSLLLALRLVSADKGGIYFIDRRNHSSIRPAYVTRPPPIDHPTTSTPYNYPVYQSCPTPNTVLNFANVGLKRIGDAFVRSTETRKLYLNQNEITEISDVAFEALPKLEYLDLSGNNITAKKLLWFKSHLNLRNLIIDDNRYITNEPSIDNVFQVLPMLQELSLRRDNIFQLNVNLTEFAPRLKRLDLSENKIATVDFLSDSPRTLSYLYLDDNAIANFVDNALNNMKELSVSGNRIEELCHTSCNTNSLSLEGMPKLLKLNASRNRIGNIANDAFLNTMHLTVLDLSSNAIKALPDSILSLQIQKLHLAHNGLTSLSNLCYLSRLQYLDLSYNHIAEVTGANLCELKFLETLLLSNNHILNIDSNAFLKLRMLHTLDLSGNVIDALPVNLIFHTQRLQILSLKNNSISNIDKLFVERWSSLKELHIEGNPVQYLNVWFLPNLTIHMNEQKLCNMDSDPVEESAEKDVSQEENEVETSWSY